MGRLYSIKECAELLCLSRRTILRWCQLGKIICHRHGNKWFVSQETIDEISAPIPQRQTFRTTRKPLNAFVAQPEVVRGLEVEALTDESDRQDDYQSEEDKIRRRYINLIARAQNSDVVQIYRRKLAELEDHWASRKQTPEPKRVPGVNYSNPDLGLNNTE